MVFFTFHRITWWSVSAAHRKQPEVRICRLSIQSCVGTCPPSPSTFSDDMALENRVERVRNLALPPVFAGLASGVTHGAPQVRWSLQLMTQDGGKTAQLQGDHEGRRGSTTKSGGMWDFSPRNWLMQRRADGIRLGVI